MWPSRLLPRTAGYPKYDGQEEGRKWTLCPEGPTVASSNADVRWSSHNELVGAAFLGFRFVVSVHPVGAFCPLLPLFLGFHSDLPKRAALEYDDGLPPPG